MNHQKQPDNQIPVPTREVITEQQVAACMTVLHHLQPYILGPALGKFAFPDEVPDRPDLDGGVAAAVSVAAMSVFSRLEKLFTDDARWDAGNSIDLIAQLIVTQKEQQTFLREQAAAARMIQLPHFQLKPELVHDGHNFFATWGDARRPGGQIIGMGATPAAALVDFDAAFERAPAEQLTLILDQTEKPPTQPE